MNISLLLTLGQSAKGLGFMVNTVKEAMVRLGDDPADDQILEAISETGFKILSNPLSKRALLLYIVHVEATRRFIANADIGLSYDKCMTEALADAEDFLSFGNLQSIALKVWRNRV